MSLENLMMALGIILLVGVFSIAGLVVFYQFSPRPYIPTWVGILEVICVATYGGMVLTWAWAVEHQNTRKKDKSEKFGGRN